MKYRIIFIMCTLLAFFSCKEDDSNCCDQSTEGNLIIKLKFDPTQERLNNFGQPSTIPPGNAAQSPVFNRMSLNYIELAPSSNTLLGNGTVIYTGAETSAGGDLAINFQEADFAGNDEVFLTIPLDEIPAGDFEWVRVSLAYQEGDIEVLNGGFDFRGTLASFLGYNTYISSFDINGSNIEVNENKLQGFWAFETQGIVFEGQAPEGATTVPNPLFDSSPVPQGSCVITGEFENGFSITENETQDKTITLSFSVNQSFEWVEVIPDGKYEPAIGEQVVDMGVRGLKTEVSN